jgi:hypothetical protein
MDRRELILARLPLFAASATGLKSDRNVNDFSDLARPLVVSLDGDEEAAEGDPEGRPVNAPRRVGVKAQFVVLIGEPAATIGTTINGYRAKLLKAIVTDAELLALLLDPASRQSIRYQGSTFALSSGRTAEAELRLDFTFWYILRFDEL